MWSTAACRLGARCLVFLSKSIIPLSFVSYGWSDITGVCPLHSAMAALGQYSTIGLKGQKRGGELVCFRKERKKNSRLQLGGKIEDVVEGPIHEAV